jgi:hypothetical protein
MPPGPATSFGLHAGVALSAARGVSWLKIPLQYLVTQMPLLLLRISCACLHLCWYIVRWNACICMRVCIFMYVLVHAITQGAYRVWLGAVADPLADHVPHTGVQLPTAVQLPTCQTVAERLGRPGISPLVAVGESLLQQVCWP